MSLPAPASADLHNCRCERKLNSDHHLGVMSYRIGGSGGSRSGGVVVSMPLRSRSASRDGRSSLKPGGDWRGAGCMPAVPSLAAAAAAVAAGTTTDSASSGSSSTGVADSDCAICFEALSSQGGPVPLPCSCHVSYCHSCWDRALAASVSACGLAKCPSCRCAMRVDYDTTMERLVFSRAQTSSSSMDEEGFMYEDDWQQRLYEQAKPAQIRLLQQYGGRNPGRSTTPVRPWGPVRAASAAPEADAEGVTPSSANAPFTANAAPVEKRVSSALRLPQCVCGSLFRRMTVEERVLAFVAEEAPAPPPPHMVERLLTSPPIFCDICDRRLGPSHRVWTCENGRRTILHAAAYDVCEACFSYHVHGHTNLSANSYRDPSRARRKGGRIGSAW